MLKQISAVIPTAFLIPNTSIAYFSLKVQFYLSGMITMVHDHFLEVIPRVGEPIALLLALLDTLSEPLPTRDRSAVLTLLSAVQSVR